MNEIWRGREKGLGVLSFQGLWSDRWALEQEGVTQNPEGCRKENLSQWGIYQSWDLSHGSTFSL